MRLKYNFIGLILACGLGLSSCNDSFLDRNPKDQLSDASFWKNAEDAQKFATGIYLYLIEPENHTIIIRKTKCSPLFKRSDISYKTKRPPKNNFPKYSRGSKKSTGKFCFSQCFFL